MILRLLAQQLTQQQRCHHLPKALTAALGDSCPQQDCFFLLVLLTQPKIPLKWGLADVFWPIPCSGSIKQWQKTAQAPSGEPGATYMENKQILLHIGVRKTLPKCPNAEAPQGLQHYCPKWHHCVLLPSSPHTPSTPLLPAPMLRYHHSTSFPENWNE